MAGLRLRRMAETIDREDESDTIVAFMDYSCMAFQKPLSASKTISVSVKEYERLKDVEKRFEKMHKIVSASFFAPPSTRDSSEIIREMKKTGRYSAAFLKSLKKGMSESDFFAK